jgi:hypothetical protein
MASYSSNADGLMVDDNHCSSKLIEVQPLKRDRSKFQVRPPAFFLWPEKNYASMAPGGMLSQVCESLVGCNQPALFILNARPKSFIGGALPTLLNDRHRLVTEPNQQLSHLSRQDLHPP